MKEDIKTLIQEMAGHICKTHDTIRKTAKIFGYSKSTVHKYVTIKLLTLDRNLYERTKQVLNENFAQKHIRGGESTKRKYENELH